MKKAFSLIETMIAIAVIFIGFAAIVSIGLSSLSNVNSSKIKVKATSVAQGFLEKFRSERDFEGIAKFTTLRSSLLATPIIIDNIKITPIITIYYPDTSTSIVEITCRWNYKRQEEVKKSIYLTNLNNRFPTIQSALCCSVPAWMSPMPPTNSPVPTATQTIAPTLTVTPAPSFTPAPTCVPNGGGCNGLDAVCCSNFCDTWEDPDVCANY